MSDNEYLRKMEEAYSLISQANKDMISLWFKGTFLGWRWWLGLCLSIIPWALWFKFRKKDSTDRLLFAGFFVILISSWFNLIGILFGWWSYYYNVVPFSPALVPWDFTLLPVAVMTLIQIGPRVNPILKAIGFSMFSSFVVEPFFIFLRMYNAKNWKHIYSLPIIFCIYLISDWFSKRPHFTRIQNK